MVTPRFGVIVPVYNEASLIGDTARALLSALQGQGAAVVFVCNGVSDGSDHILSDLLAAFRARHGPDPQARLLVLPTPGKTRALAAAEAELPVFPRFYVDADVTLTPEVLPRLAAELTSGAADLVSPRIRFDTSRATWLAASMARLWLDLPHGQTAAFHHVIGVSAAGRATWGGFPDILGDDAFIAAQVPPERRKLVKDVCITTLPPLSFRDMIRVRIRWQAGHRQLRDLGVSVAPTPGQRDALWAQLWRRRGHRRLGLSPGQSAGRLQSELQARLQPRWRRDPPDPPWAQSR